MNSRTRRRITFGALAGAVSMILPASLAWACTGLASLSSTASSTSPGRSIDIAGQGYAKNGGAVSLRFDSGWGDVLATARPDRNGKFRASLGVPELAPGHHVLLAIQSDVSGKSIVATGSVPIEVVGGSPVLSPVPAAASSPRAPSGGSAGSPWVLPAALGLGAGVLLVVAAASLAVQRRAVLAPVRIPPGRATP